MEYKKGQYKLPEKNKYYYVEEGNFFMIGKVDVPLNEEDSSKDIFKGSCHYFIARGYQSLYRGESWCYKDYNRTFRLATQEEIDWLEYCNKIDKYVTKEEFLKQTKIMKKEDFSFEGPESLKKAFGEELGLVPTSSYSWEYMTSGSPKFHKNICGTLSKEAVHFILPQDWDKAIKYAKEFYVEEETKKSLYFGDVEFICDKEAKAAATSYGKVTLEDIEEVIDYIHNPPKLAGYPLEMNITDDATYTIKFGCKVGKLAELEAIADFLRS